MPVSRKMTAWFPHGISPEDASEMEGHWPLLEFVYENWHGITHSYIVAPECVEWTSYHHSDADRNQGEETWMMNAQVISRSGEDRPGRRSFVMSKMRHVREVSMPV